MRAPSLIGRKIAVISANAVGGLGAAHTGLAENSIQALCGGAGPQIEDRRGWGQSMDAL
jgi:hypothetical protein